jgi:hypothetical protein
LGFALNSEKSSEGSSIARAERVSIGSDGTLTASYSNGQNQAIGQLAVATVNNQQGLSSVGSDDYQATSTSGGASMGVAGTGGRGAIEGGDTEASLAGILRPDRCATRFRSELQSGNNLRYRNSGNDQHDPLTELDRIGQQIVTRMPCFERATMQSGRHSCFYHLLAIRRCTLTSLRTNQRRHYFPGAKTTHGSGRDPDCELRSKTRT